MLQEKAFINFLFKGIQLARVFFVWFKWPVQTIDNDKKMLVCKVAETNGVEEAVLQLLPGRRDVLLMALISIFIGGAIFLFEANLNSLGRNNGLVEILFKVFSVLFAWAIIQLPIYYISLLIARWRCSKWIKGILKSDYTPIVCRMFFRRKNDSRLLWEERYSLNSLINSANQISKDIDKKEVDSKREGEFMVRLLLNGKDPALKVPIETIKMALAKLATLVDLDPKLKDVFCFYLDANGEIVGTRTREGYETLNRQLGFLPVN